LIRADGLPGVYGLAEDRVDRLGEAVPTLWCAGRRRAATYVDSYAFSVGKERR
jgi:hypothetical protein